MCMCCNPANGKLDIKEGLVYTTQAHGGNKWIDILSVDWDHFHKKLSNF